jgi:hypothetical protein
MANEYDPLEWVKDLRRNVGDQLVRDIVNDFRNYSPTHRPDPSAKVLPVGAGRVAEPDPGVAHRPLQDQSGWRDPPKVDDWKPPGLEHMDRMMDAQDAADRAARLRELAQTAAIQRAEAAIKAEAEQPKERKDKGQK